MRLPDGRVEHRYTTGPWHWHAHDVDPWLEIDTDLEPRADSTWKHGVKSARFDTLLTDDGRRRFVPRRWVPTEFVEFGRLEFQRTNGSWVTVPAGTMSRDGHRLVGADSQDGRLEVGFHGAGSRTMLVLKRATWARPLRWSVTLHGLTLKDGALVSDSDGEKVGFLRPPSWSDAADPAPRPVPWKIDGGYVTVTPDLTGAVFPVTVDPDYSIATGGDDGQASPSLGTFQNNQTYIYLGRSSSGNTYCGCFRFQGIAAAQGADCTAATLKLTSYGFNGTQSAGRLKVYGVKEADHAAPTDYASWSTDHGIHTTAAVDWDGAAWGTGTQVSSPDLAAIFDELFAQASWASGNDVGLHCDEDGAASEAFAYLASYENTSYTEPVLSLTVTGGVLEATLDAATRKRTAQDVTVTAGPVTVKLDPAKRKRTALDLLAKYPQTLTLDVAARRRTAQDVAASRANGPITSIYGWCSAGFGETWKSANPTWTDLTDYLREFNISWGRSGEYDAYRAGTATIVLDSRSRRFDPTYRAGTYYGQIKPWVPIKAGITFTDGTSTTSTCLFSGFVERWVLDYPAKGSDATVQVQATDGLKIPANYEITLNTASTTPGSQVGAILTEIGWSTGSLWRTIDDGSVALSSSTGNKDVTALSMINTVMLSEGGYFYSMPHSTAHTPRLVFRARTYPQSNNTITATFGEETQYARYADMSLTYDEERLRNRWRIGIVGSTKVAESNATASQDAYGLRVYAQTGLLLPNTSSADERASFGVAQTSVPALAGTVTSTLHLGVRYERAVDVAVDAYGPLRWVKVRRGGLDEDMIVDGCSVNYRVGEPCEFSYQLSPASVGSNYWILGDATLGKLDETAILGW